MKPQLSKDGRHIIIRIPMEFRRMGGRKTIVAPDGAEGLPVPKAKQDDALLKALARAHRWKGMLESGEVASVKDLAKQEKIDDSYVARVLRLTLLAPDIVEAILNGCQPDGMSYRELAKPFPVEWSLQREKWGFQSV